MKMKSMSVLFTATMMMAGLAACETGLDGPANNGGQQDAGPQQDAAGTDTGHTCPAGYHWDDAVDACVQNSGTDAGTTDTGHTCPSGYHWDETYDVCVQDSTDGGNVSGNVRITAGTNGNVTADRIVLNAEFAEGATAEYFCGWAELGQVTNATRIEETENVSSLRCVRFNTVVTDSGEEDYLCYGYGDAATFHGTATVTVSGTSWAVSKVSVIWKEGNATLYGCSAIACAPGTSAPSYLDCR
jgi:hypothetical protein